MSIVPSVVDEELSAGSRFSADISSNGDEAKSSVVVGADGAAFSEVEPSTDVVLSGGVSFSDGLEISSEVDSVGVDKLEFSTMVILSDVPSVTVFSAEPISPDKLVSSVVAVFSEVLSVGLVGEVASSVAVVSSVGGVITNADDESAGTVGSEGMFSVTVVLSTETLSVGISPTKVFSPVVLSDAVSSGVASPTVPLSDEVVFSAGTVSPLPALSPRRSSIVTAGWSGGGVGGVWR